ncbi:helix-turn-helix transcriptional regulator [Salidesulfovibrio onnuriiensis]|uniref:helix-turn-helix transcriptional regulator n=1 Tax=Salidesulfovibrio onnuriiensis TaxID=2583823 RepID=UPI0011C80796|nr:helix-turn-helix transcriptional regulator [Salidesulfovibrio onnuriiensis]
MHGLPEMGRLHERCDVSLGEFCFSVMDAVKALIAYVDRGYNYRYVNEAYSRFFNKPMEACLGGHVCEVMDPAVFEAGIKPQLDACFTGKTVAHEGWLPLPELGECYVDVRYFPHIVDNDVVGAAVVAHDLTDKKAMIRDVVTQNRELESNLKQLAESNRKLQLLLEGALSDRQKTESKAYDRVSESIAPYLRALKAESGDSRTAELADSIESALLNYKPELDQKLYKLNPGLSAKERHIAHLIVGGKTSQEIAEILEKSVKTVEYYRSSLRKKLKLDGRRISLRTYLVS